MTIIRYDQTGYDRGLVPASDGGLVSHTDHLAAMAEKDAEIARLRAATPQNTVYLGQHSVAPALTEIERAAYERGVRDAAAQVADTCPHADVPGGNCTPDTFDEGTSAAYEAILALLTQEGR